MLEGHKASHEDGLEAIVGRVGDAGPLFKVADKEGFKEAEEDERGGSEEDSEREVFGEREGAVERLEGLGKDGEGEEGDEEVGEGEVKERKGEESGDPKVRR